LPLPLLSACAARDTPTARFCAAALSFGATPSASTLDKCRCADRLAQRQLEPQSYRLLDDAAAASLREGTSLRAVGDAERVAKTNPLEKIATAADLASVVLKAASRCAVPRP
jgi:hypothetical protein